MPNEIRRIRTGTLKPHPINQQVYEDANIDDLVESIRRHGIIEPLVVTPERIVISGHRRLTAAVHLGLKTVPARCERFADEVAALVEFNRQRVKSWSERYRELQILLPRVSNVASERRLAGARRGAARRHGLPVTNIGHRHGRCRVYEEAGRISGLGRESARKLIRVFEAINAGHASVDLANRLDSGKISLHRAYLQVRKASLSGDGTGSREEPRELNMDFEPIDLWSFHKRDRRFDLPGAESSGAPPPQAWVRLISWLTEKDDLVVDPMAGTGTVQRVCNALGRECLAFDISPRGPGVAAHNLLKGFPSMPRRPKLVILDPPYHDQRTYSRRRDDLSRCRSVEEYLRKLSQCIEVCLRAIAPDGTVAVVAGSDTRVATFDLAWEVGILVRQHAQNVQRIWLPYAAHLHAGHRLQQARKRHTLLTVKREIFVARPNSSKR